MKYSILIPSYNCEKYIQYCLKSIQTVFSADYEVIIVDDGSTDRSVDTINKAIDLMHMPIKLYTSNHKGVADARNVCLQKASGKYILFVDADDELCSNYLSIIEPLIDLNDFDIFHFNFLYIDNNGNTLGINKAQIEGRFQGSEIINNAYLQDLYTNTLWTNVYLRDFILQKKLHFYEGILHEDEEFILRTLLAADTVYSTNYCLYQYRKNDESVTRNNIYLYQRTKDKFTIFNSFINDRTIDENVRRNLYCYLAMAVLMEGTHYQSDSPEFAEFEKECKKDHVLSYLYGFNAYYTGLKIVAGISQKMANNLLRMIMNKRNKENQ